MSGLEEELLQDFLTESSELLELLDEQLLTLETDPTNTELLNAVFRAFHTVKGGAGFLNLAPMVTLCHRAETVLDKLRSGTIKLNPALLSLIFEAVTAAKDQLANVQEGAVLAEPDPALLNRLDKAGNQVAPPAGSDTPAHPNKAHADPQGTPEDPAEAIYERLVAAAADAPSSPMPEQSAEQSGMSDDEFEALLDQIHGPGGAPGAPGEDEPAPESQATAPAQSPPAPATPTSGPAPAGTTHLADPQSNIRVQTARLDDCMNLAGELVLIRNRLFRAATHIDDEQLRQLLRSLDRTVSELQEATLKLRMQPARRLFLRFQRLTRDLAVKLDKPVQIRLHGEETELDKHVLERLSDPLTHLVRNAIDHGIEPSDERRANGKPPEGLIELRAEHQGDSVLIKLRDDGRGIDPARLRKRAVEAGLIETGAANNLSDRESLDLMFLPGFSTRTAVSDISGRGVGMDVVRSAIAELNGKLDIDSGPGRGTTFNLVIPLTLTILPTLLVNVTQRLFAFPIARVRELTLWADHSHHRIARQPIVLIRGESFPLFDLRAILGGVQNPEMDANTQVLIIEAANRRVAMLVDHVIGQQELVTKPLAQDVAHMAGISASAITDTGKIALILDADELVRALLLGEAA